MSRKIYSYIQEKVSSLDIDRLSKLSSAVSSCDYRSFDEVHIDLDDYDDFDEKDESVEALNIDRDKISMVVFYG